eukprot:7391911-Prymnesium_polylepis.3
MGSAPAPASAGTCRCCCAQALVRSTSASDARAGCQSSHRVGNPALVGHAAARACGAATDPARGWLTARGSRLARGSHQTRSACSRRWNTRPRRRHQPSSRRREPAARRSSERPARRALASRRRWLGIASRRRRRCCGRRRGRTAQDLGDSPSCMRRTRRRAAAVCRRRGWVPPHTETPRRDPRAAPGRSAAASVHRRATHADHRGVKPSLEYGHRSLDSSSCRSCGSNEMASSRWPRGAHPACGSQLPWSASWLSAGG